MALQADEWKRVETDDGAQLIVWHDSGSDLYVVTLAGEDPEPDRAEWYTKRTAYRRLKASGWSPDPSDRVTVALYLGKAQVDHLDSLAFEQDTSRSEVVRNLIDEAMVGVDSEPRHPSVAGVLAHLTRQSDTQLSGLTFDLFRSLAEYMADSEASGPELTVALRKLVECRDAFTRSLDHEGD